MSAKEKPELWMRLLARMKADKKFEAAVYIALLMLGLLVYLLIPETKTPTGPTATIGGGAKTDRSASIEQQLEETLRCMRGVGETRVMLTYNLGETEEEIYGVIVLAQGARDIMVRTRIQSAVQTVLNVDAARINVFEMEQIAEVE